jgi:hypothetical protein
MSGRGGTGQARAAFKATAAALRRWVGSGARGARLVAWIEVRWAGWRLRASAPGGWTPRTAGGWACTLRGPSPAGADGRERARGGAGGRLGAATSQQPRLARAVQRGRGREGTAQASCHAAAAAARSACLAAWRAAPQSVVQKGGRADYRRASSPHSHAQVASRLMPARRDAGAAAGGTCNGSP